MPKISIVKVLFVFCVLPLLGFYIFQTGDIVRTSYWSAVYQVQIEKIKERNIALQSEALNMFYLGNVELKMTSLSFVPVSEIKYLSLNDGRLAKVAVSSVSEANR